MKKMKEIYQYSDYRDFLLDYYNYKQTKIKGYSRRQMVVELGFSSPGYLTLIINKERNLGRNGAKKISLALKLNENEERYFLCLVRYCNAKIEKKEKLFRELQSYVPKSIKKTLRDSDKYFYENRMCGVILMLINVYRERFNLDALWIFNRVRLKTTVQEINNAIVYLKEEKLIEKSGEHYVNMAKSIKSPDEEKSEIIQLAHKQFLEEAKNALSIPLESREFAHLTFTIGSDDFPAVKAKIKKIQEEFRYFLADLQKKSKMKNKTAVSLNIQLYPITK